jgi:hypothetical protein
VSSSSKRGGLLPAVASTRRRGPHQIRFAASAETWISIKCFYNPDE